eukprot:5305527-Pyramimonas_sp.AAC.1
MEQRYNTGACPRNRGGAAGNRPLEEPSSLVCPLCDHLALDVPVLKAHVRSHFDHSSALWLPRVFFTDVPPASSPDGGRDDSGGSSTPAETGSDGGRARPTDRAAGEVDGEG